MKLQNLLRLAFGAGASAVLAAAAQAGITDPGLLITATNANGTGSYTVFLSNGTWSSDHSTWEWTSDTNGYDIYDTVNFTKLAHVSLMHCKMQADPSVIVNFNVTSTSVATTFSVTTGVLSFGAMTNPSARASAGMTITDNDSDGATDTGLHAGGKNYRANYNGTIPLGTSYANLVGSFTAPVDDSNSASEASPLVGYNTIVGSVSSMQAEFDFTLSANDSASGTSFYEIIPAPGATLVLAGAGMMALRRRR